MYTKSFLTSFLAAAPVALGAAVVQDSECDCYLTDGAKPSYFKSHMFFDFRSLSQYAGYPDMPETRDASQAAPLSSAYFDSEGEFSKTWGIQNWRNGNETFLMQNSYSNLYIETNDDPVPQTDTWLTMRTARHNGFQSASEFESREAYQYASMRMHARTSGPPGACTAMFTYLEGVETLAETQEADIEVLTRDPETIINYTNQPSYTDDDEVVEGAGHAVTMPGGVKWYEWATHRMDWLPSEVIWSVNGQQSWRNSFQVPRDPSRLLFNAWSNGGVWTGLMAEGGVAYQQIQWIEILHGPTDKASCNRVCSIDQSTVVGKPVRV
ncbi:hypothetical protein FZEAL_6695 [Fusarium zealandicum]|uniref:GH16 domain-containing protein n=1 Tax=Fusarium zealandicum TaxID=1053134 RepID=A0A8H4UI10_9HYPO|nr:hypothetical protein FZEAL_6695 [Fusarium zealandicum]